MWISQFDSEVNKFHPVCEKTLNNALKIISKDSEYKVLHHEYTGTLEMDFVIQNRATKQYLCVIEVKKTLSDVSSARYQYQAMSYVQNLSSVGKPYYILTNLEYVFAFRFDSKRPRVVQQMLEPGLVHIGNFVDFTQAEFEKRLSDYFSEMISDFIDDRYKYLVTLDQFEKHMRNLIGNNAKWKSSLVVLLYEYIRGAFTSIGRGDLPYDVRTFRNNIERICTEAATVNFKEIFTYSASSHEAKATVPSDILSKIFDFGKQSVSGDSIAGLLHSIISTDKEHEGEVPTDLELARIVAILAKSIVIDVKDDALICDPAVGSGNLISSAADIFAVAPNQLKANDVNERLLELLSLRIGLNYPKIITNHNSAVITAYSIADLSAEYFEDVSVVVMNPPFVAGINCTNRKQEILRKIRKVKGKKATTDVGQMNLEGVFLELVCSLCKSDTVISCVFPKTHLVARGKEAVELRKLLLTDFGLKVVFSYPEEGLFEDVTKGTCVLVGRIGHNADSVKFISSSSLVSDIDLHLFENIIKEDFPVDKFASISPGIDGFEMTKEHLSELVESGWRQVCREFDDALIYQKLYFEANDMLIKMSAMDYGTLPRKRGVAGNSGASDLLMVDRDKEFFKYFKELPTISAMRNAKHGEMIVSEGDTIYFDVTKISDDDLEKIVDYYIMIPKREGRQQKKDKSRTELIELLKTTFQKSSFANSVLIPRGIRSLGKVYVAENTAVVSTNFIAISFMSKEESLIFASWVSTIFYQLICEINAKPQEGMRKMEVGDIEETFIPILSKITYEQRTEILEESQNINFLVLNSPKIRKTDRIWANILFEQESDVRLTEARRLLEFLANTRNPIADFEDSV